MSRPSTPIYISSRDSTPSSSSESENATMNNAIRVHHARGCMTTTTITPLTVTQIHHNAMEDTCEYHDSRIDKLSDEVGASYSWMFMHGAMISHWVEMFQEPISVMLTNFSATPSITIPAVHVTNLLLYVSRWDATRAWS